MLLPEYHELSLDPCQAQWRRAPRTQLQLEDKEVNSSIDSSRASLKIRKESSACPETMEGANKGQNPPDPNNTIGSAAAWTPHGEFVQGRNLNCKGIIAQGFLCSGSLSGATQLKLFCSAVALNKLIWRMSCRRFCFGKPRVEPEGWGSTQECECVCEESKRGTHRLTGVAGCEGTPDLPVKVLGGVCATPWMLCECSGSGFSLNTCFEIWRLDDNKWNLEIILRVKVQTYSMMTRFLWL